MKISTKLGLMGAITTSVVAFLKTFDGGTLNEIVLITGVVFMIFIALYFMLLTFEATGCLED